MNLNFKEFYSFNQYKDLIEVELVENKKEKKEYDKIFEKEKIFDKAIINFLKEKVKLGELGMPMNSDSHYFNFLSHWENLVEGKLREAEEDRISYVFSKILSYHNMKLTYAKEPVTLPMIEKSYEELIDKLNKGDFKGYDLECDSECFGCGHKIKLMTHDWKVKLFSLSFKDDNSNKLEFKALEKCIEEKLYQVTVEFKTGELLMADWFRIPEFTKHVEYNTDYKELSINSDLGKIKSTQHAAKLGFITIHVGNSSPHIYQEGDSFVFGHEKEKSKQKDYEDKGYICTDLWNATIIDKSRLIKIVSKKLGLEKAQETVEKYLEEEKNNINFINVEPGKYTISYYPRKNINKLEHELPKDIETMFSMKKETPKKKLKM